MTPRTIDRLFGAFAALACASAIVALATGQYQIIPASVAMALIAGILWRVSNVR